MLSGAENFHKNFEAFLAQHFEQREKLLRTNAKHLHKAVQYSLFSGGKRFRPHLTNLVAKVFELGEESILPWAAAIECVHTYSLIHDDLPCMDDDDMRRGQQTTHKKFDESTALLAGDALLTEAFYIIAKHYKNTPEIAVQLTECLADSAGYVGMVAGQVEDLFIEQSAGVEVTQDMILGIHHRKTGALIKASAAGVAIIARASAEMRERTSSLGENLGLAFQLADDLLDFDPQNKEAAGLPSIIGVEQTRKLLIQISAQAENELSSLGAVASTGTLTSSSAGTVISSSAAIDPGASTTAAPINRGVAQLRDLIQYNSLRKS